MLACLHAGCMKSGISPCPTSYMMDEIRLGSLPTPCPNASDAQVTLTTNLGSEGAVAAPAGLNMHALPSLQQVVSPRLTFELCDGQSTGEYQEQQQAYKPMPLPFFSASHGNCSRSPIEGPQSFRPTAGCMTSLSQRLVDADMY